MGHTVHMCLDIRGALRWPKKRLANMFRRPDGRYATWLEAQNYLIDCIAEGKSVIPIGEECEGFSYETGCPGHRGEL